MAKIQKYRRNGFSADLISGEDDFTLVDLDVMPHDEESSPVPLNHFLDDDEFFNRSLMNIDFDANEKLEETEIELKGEAIGDTDLNEDFAGSDQFAVEPVEQPELNKNAEAEKFPFTATYSKANFEEIPDEEETIDRLLVDAGFDANDGLEDTDSRSSGPILDGIDLADDFSDIDVPVEQEEIDMLTNADKIPAREAYSNSDFDELSDQEEVIDRLLVNAFYDTHEELEEADKGLATGNERINRVNDIDENIKAHNAVTSDIRVIDSGENKLAFDKKPTKSFYDNSDTPENLKQERIIRERANREEVLHDGLGIKSFSSGISEQKVVKNEINDNDNKVKKKYRIKVRKTNRINYVALGFGIAAFLSSVVMGVIVINLQSKVSKLTELVSILEEDMITVAGKNSDMDINNTDASIDLLNQKADGVVEHIKELGYSQATAATQEKKKPEITSKKMLFENKSVSQKNGIEQTQSLTALPEKTTTVDKKSAPFNKLADLQKNSHPISEKKKLSGTTEKLNKAKPASGWSVNLTAYEDQTYAKRKAAKFIQKGIPVKVIAVDMNKKRWYQLKVGGFKNKENAASYAAKIKKSFNLNSVSVR
ncbi:MAG: SPOR domain-containing protein [Methylococcales bacterium]|nr:SPOR domain-containing protein [Methylococcales bacterium]